MVISYGSFQGDSFNHGIFYLCLTACLENGEWFENRKKT